MLSRCSRLERVLGAKVGGLAKEAGLVRPGQRVIGSGSDRGRYSPATSRLFSIQPPIVSEPSDDRALLKVLKVLRAGRAELQEGD